MVSTGGSMNKWQKDVEEFHRMSGRSTINSRMDGLPLRNSLIQEEAKEVDMAVRDIEATEDSHDIVWLSRMDERRAEYVKELVDLLYVTIGGFVELGVDAEAVWNAVHASNMSKVDGTLGPIQRRSDGKVIKPLGWKAPDIAALLRDGGK
jgi:predicted HAD superfamily Cof-like phosphohydrolase